MGCLAKDPPMGNESQVDEMPILFWEKTLKFPLDFQQGVLFFG